MSTDSPVYIKGRKLAQELFGDPDGDVGDLPLSPDDPLRKELVAWVFGYLMQERSLLPVKLKVLCAIAMSTCLNQPEVIRRWLIAARNAGCSREEVQETILTMSIYAGFPTARSALGVLAAHWPAEAK